MKNLLMLLLLSTQLVACGFEVVDTGYRGVETNFGKVVSESLPEGLYFYNPFTSDIKELDVRTQKYEDKTSGYSSDAQIVKVASTINFNLDPTKAHITYQEVGYDWAEKLIVQVLHGTIKEVAGRYKAVDLIANREEITSAIKETLTTRLASKHILLTSFDINDLDFDNDFEQAVKNKVIAVEQAKEMKNKTVTVQERARQEVIQEKANAEKLVIDAGAKAQSEVLAAKADAEAKLLRANAEAKANTTVAKSLTPALIKYEKVKNWNGQLPKVTGGSGMLISIDGDK